MLKSLKIKNFRALEDFEVSTLGRVNLIVGKNSSGKSSVLEALRIFAGSADLSLLESIADSHGEKFQFRDFEHQGQSDSLPFEEFFSGRHYPNDDEKSILISDPLTEQSLEISHAFYREEKESYVDTNGEVNERIRRKPVLKSEFKTLKSLAYEIAGQALYINSNSMPIRVLRLNSLSTRFRPRMPDFPNLKPCSFIPTQFISIDELADEWDSIALTDNQNIVKDALRIVSPEFEDMTFVRNDDDDARLSSRVLNRTRLRRTAKVKLSNHERPVSLQSLGDGMLRVCQLILKIFPAKGGFLLIDEFENGLHYSVQESVWKLVFQLAQKLDIQVFATTHSWDCIESFAKVAKEHEDIEGVLFRVGQSVRKSDKGRVIATVFNEEELFNITQADVEVR